eukprot:TRINITY_DN3328_c0_g1_i11.p2 TRINITY_DN3328_c0_g1~~TRINITY_DN3328_c0_g1_i11.p2  ORF type:complete len:251 (+),score=113.24 TRINITY_DN3328_c0_g1_i11:889-1641(+)
MQKMKSEYNHVTRELEKRQESDKEAVVLREQLAETKGKLLTATEELSRAKEVLNALRKEKTEIQSQSSKLEEKSELMYIESKLYNEKYKEELKATQELKNECERLKLELARAQDKSRIIEEYQDKVEQLGKQLKSKQEEIAANKKEIENLNGILSAEEARWEWLIKARENELYQVQDALAKAKARLATSEEEHKKKEQADSLLRKAEADLAEAKGEAEKIAVEKEEIRKYAESLLGKLKKKDTNSTYLVV